jgi:RNA polymerase sigma-70 factor (ECF subfamily)
VTIAVDSTETISQLYASHHAWLYGWLRRKLGCSHGASDLVQDVFVRILASRDALCGMREPRAYLTTTAQRLMVDRIRRETIERAYLAELAIVMEGAPVQPSPEQILLTLEALAQIAELLSGVSVKAREAFLLHYLEDIPHGEIARRLEVSTRMVHKYLVQCLVQCAAAKPD